MDVFAPRYTNEAAAREHLERLRWPDGPFCPHCGSYEATRLEGKKHRKGLIQCNDCREQYTVTVGTVFERSKVPLHKWLFVNHLLVSSKKGISAHQIHRMIGVTYKTAWFMCHRLRTAMAPGANVPPLGGSGAIVEADETFVGGKAHNRAFRETAPKKIVVALVERGGHARSFHVANVTSKTLRPLVVTHIDRASHLVTDGFRSYTEVGREFSTHASVNHAVGEYARGFDHSNTVENFFSIFKRGVIGTYHHLSEAHLHRYTAEFDFRYNTRLDTDADRADQSLRGIYGRRLTYRRPRLLAA
jgi:transposase-like protein